MSDKVSEVKATKLEAVLLFMLGRMSAMYVPDLHANLKDDVPVLSVTHDGVTRNLTVGHIREAHLIYHALVDGEPQGYDFISFTGMKGVVATFKGGGGGKSG